MTTLHAIGNWLYHYLGVAGVGPWYGTWSGWLADILIPFSLLSGIAVYMKHNNCHEGGEWPHGCRRLGHPVQGTPFRACHRHHPILSQHTHVTAEIMAKEHVAAKELVAAQHKLLNEIHRHVTASSPSAGGFPPETPSDVETRP